MSGPIQKSQTKKGWTKPQLLILARGNPEEAVFSACKGGILTGPTQTDGSCIRTGIGCTACATSTLS
jgi:hypothetical protein